MNRSYRHTMLLGLGLAALAMPLRAQEETADGEEEKRVQYQLVLPEEKTPETVKPEEHNPFESESEAQNRLAPGDSEENRVRDKLLKLQVVGTVRMPDGRMSVLLGNIKLETGKTVPPVLPDQMVELRVKNITSEHIELAWQEKRATGLPPKLMLIPINISPKVRYQMLGQTGEDNKTGNVPNATMDLPTRQIARQETAPPAALPVTESSPVEDLLMDAPARTPPAATVTSSPPATPAPAAAPQEQEKPAAAPTPPSPAVESMVRMLFGNPTPAPK
ncbi:MAG: hypothetical protein Q8M07_27010 [Prosthecobacter sp.]|nr:hypothetical protein [Prosthecobacter sp.]